jgi:phosphohistidine phosphatase
MKLLVVRHAIAMERSEYQEQNPGASDDLRPLTPEGIRKMKKNTKGLRRIVSCPDALVSSPLVRAIQTAEILRDEAWPRLRILETESLRPDSLTEDLAQWLRRLWEKNYRLAEPDALIAVVGHEPHLSAQVSWLLSGSGKSFVDFKKGGACLLSFEKNPGRGKGRLLWCATPRILRQMDSMSATIRGVRSELR